MEVNEKREMLLRLRQRTLIVGTSILVPAVVVGWFWFVGGMRLW